MQYVKKDGMCISKFSLGTVQLGMNYGLGEFATKPSKSEAFRILNRAVELGVNTFDTANDYGDSEQLIGQWLPHIELCASTIYKSGASVHAMQTVYYGSFYFSTFFLTRNTHIFY